MKDDITFKIGFDVDDRAADKVLRRSRKLQRQIKREGLGSVGIEPFTFTTQAIPQGKSYRPVDFQMLNESIKMFTSKMKALPNPQWMYPSTNVKPESYISKYRKQFQEQLKREQAILHKDDGVIWQSANAGRSELEDKKYQEFALRKRMADMKEAYKFASSKGKERNFTYYDKFGNEHFAYGMSESVQEYTKAEQTLKLLNAKEKKAPKEPQKVVTQEQKAQNRELTDSIFKLSKILALWHLIKKAINGIAQGIKFVNNESQAITSRDIQEKGIFSIDAYSAMRANTDKTGAMIGRGLSFMGPSAPFSMTSFNDTVKSLQELRNKAMSGQGIQDEQQIISLQRISDMLGLGYNVASLMSNPNIDLTDFVKDLMRSVEKFLPKLDTLDDIKKSLLTSDFIKALGPELIDAISYNYNLNQRTGETASVIEKVLAAGAGAHAPIDFTAEANNLKTTMTTLNGKFDLLKQALENLFAGPLADFINNRVVPKVDDVSDAAIRYKLRQSSSPYLQAIGWAKAEASLTTQNRKAYEADEKQQLNWLKENRVKFSDEMNSLYNKVATGGTLTQNEALQALLMPYAQSSNFGSTIESLSAAAIGQSLLKRFGGRTPKDVLKNGNVSVDEKTFLGVMDKNIPITQATVSAATGNYTFLEGGLADWDPQKYGTNYENYLRTAINALGYDYNSVLASILTDSDFVNNSKAFKQVSWTNDANNDKIIDSYITIKLVDTNNHTSYVRTKITDDMKQTFAAELH